MFDVRARVCSVVLLLSAAPIVAQEERAGSPADTLRSGVVRGTIYDSLGAAPLAGATVQMIGEGGVRAFFDATTDERGAFEIRDVPRGRYLAGFFHEAFEVLALTPTGKRLLVAGGDTLDLEFAIPSGATVHRSMCGAPQKGDTTGAVAGFVRDAQSDAPLAGSTVVVLWPEIVLEPGRIRAERRQHAVRTDASGWFAVCKVPSDAEVSLRAEMGPDSSGFVPVAIVPRGVTRQSLRIGRGNEIVVVALDSTDAGAPRTSVTALRGTARVVGTVSRADGTPLKDAQVVLWGSAASATTREDGRFALDDLPHGTFTLEARLIGFVPRRSAVQLARGRTTSVAIVMDEAVPVLQTVTVYGRASWNRILESIKRAKIGGRVFTRDDIERSSIQDATDLLRRVPGVRLVPAGAMGNAITMRGGCIPVLVVDGIRYTALEDQRLMMPHPREILAMEVYTGPASVPPQFGGMRVCGAIVVWTGR